MRYATPRQRGQCRTVPTHGKPPGISAWRRNIVARVRAAPPGSSEDAVTKMPAKPTASASPQKQAERKKANVVKIQ
jgi:hypothetical protein